ncbi:MAG: single-stranded DNA-binding protein [Spirochaetia bacterium]
MTDINNLTIMGRLTKDCEMKYSSGGMAIVSFSIAVNLSERDSSGQWEDKASFFDVTLFGNQAESLSSYLAKAQQVCVQGHLKQERWNSDGVMHSRVKIVANRVNLVGGGKKETPPNNQSAKVVQSNSDFEDDIPF